MQIQLLNGKQLAAAMRVSKFYVMAMKDGGYKFKFGRQTTLPHALAWRVAHPDFRSTAYRWRGTGDVRKHQRSQQVRV